MRPLVLGLLARGGLVACAGLLIACEEESAPAATAIVHSTGQPLESILGETPRRQAERPRDPFSSRTVFIPPPPRAGEVGSRAGAARAGAEPPGGAPGLALGARTPLMIASGISGREASRLADLRERFEGGRLSTAEARERLAEMEREALRSMGAVLRGGVNPDARDEEGRTALMYAAEAGRPARVALLLRAGANPHLQAVDGVTPIMLAAASGHDHIVDLLSRAGSDANASTHDGLTPLMFAVVGDDPRTVSALLKAGADPRRCSRRGVTPEDLAQSRRDAVGWEIRRALEVAEE